MNYHDKLDLARAIMFVVLVFTAGIVFLLLLVYVPILVLGVVVGVIAGSVMWSAYTLWKDYRSNK